MKPKNNKLTFPHVKDIYFREKLENQLIAYEPHLWKDAVMNPRDERTLDKVLKSGK